MTDDDPMILLLVVALGVLPLPLLGGRLSRLGELRLRGVGLVFAALAVQVVITSVAAPPAVLGRWLHLGTYLAVIPLFWLNRKVPGLWVVLVGASLNLAAIAANGGVMPASPDAVRIAGIRHDAAFENSAPVEGARLAFLGDIFAVPEGVPLANVFSVGDVVLVVGAWVLIYLVCGASWPRRRTPAGTPAAAIEASA